MNPTKLLNLDHLHHFASPSGVMLFVYSLVLTAGLENIKSESMDVVDFGFVAKFGHCNQELVSLMLSGHAWVSVLVWSFHRVLLTFLTGTTS